MDSRQHEMARFRRRERNPHRLWIAHLPDHDDIGSLSHGGPEGGRKVRRVHADLDLFDHASAMTVLVLDRILHRNDVPRMLGVDLRYERCERRGFTGASGPADEYQAARQLREQRDIV